MGFRWNKKRVFLFLIPPESKRETLFNFFPPLYYCLLFIYVKVNIHLTLSYHQFNIGCHLGCHLDFHLTMTKTHQVWMHTISKMNKSLRSSMWKHKLGLLLKHPKRAQVKLEMMPYCSIYTWKKLVCAQYVPIWSPKCSTFTQTTNSPWVTKKCQNDAASVQYSP